MNAPLFTLFDLRITPLFLLGAVVALLLALNATLMLIAPAQYSVVPRFLRPPDSIIERQLNRRAGTGESRITGLLVLGMLSWVVYDMIHRPR